MFLKELHDERSPLVQSSTQGREWHPVQVSEEILSLHTCGFNGMSEDTQWMSSEL